ncbi:3-dehydroquinate synthase [Nonlabens xiamenensis]|uniref:3-dehydroquinate synthase n=1 Tax=Nonlabens xiamenensis TaxID=2341043 RepID=UPI000F615107|nr:3-dehydroquinate synthase [Nonlabens xiamenensis]
MDSIHGADYQIHFQDKAFDAMNQLVKKLQPSVIFILVDENTMQHCYPVFIPFLQTEARIEVIEIDAGEEHKNIDTCTGVWNALIELGCDRNSLIINLGGGVITDLGGFVASTIKRGIEFIHVPTTVLGMVDAAIGGKNGVDLGHLKNQVGVINTPAMTLVHSIFLKSLPKRQLINGSIEMFKHGLIADRVYWENMLSQGATFDSETFEHLIYQSVLIKNDVVQSDLNENGARKSLNFGHTIGHAIESFCLASDRHPALLHGEAIAAGLYLESFLSLKQAGLSKEEFDSIATWYKGLGLLLAFDQHDILEILGYMTHDKKNINGQIRFVLIAQIGSYVIDQIIPETEVISAFDLLNN